MLKFEYLAARHGDSILVHWGDANVMLVDGGPQTVYEETLSPRLMQLPHNPGEPRYLEAVCVSHVDEDHIVGVQRLLRELRRTANDGRSPELRVGTLWHNSVEEIVDVAEPGLSQAVAP